jgi:hypothetical protein
VLTDGVCKIPPPVCNSPNVLSFGSCVAPETLCLPPNVFAAGQCTTPDGVVIDPVPGDASDPMTGGYFKDIMTNWKSFQLPGVFDATCPAIQFSLPIFGVEINENRHCTLLNDYMALIRLIEIIGWVTMAALIVMSA